MGRRLIGLAVLILAIVAAVVVGGLNTKPVGGTAQAAPPPDPPPVGACLGELSGSGYPFAAIVTPCGQAHVGEVVEVMAAGALARATSADGSTSDDLDPYLACQKSADRYLGIDEGSAWYPSATVSAFLIAPDPIAEKAGSSWLVCAVGAQAGDVDQGAYDGTLRNAANGGRFPPGFAVCPLSLAQVSMSQSCTDAHQVESFATTFVDDRGALPELTASCASAITKLTGLADPTAGGRLTVALVPDETSDTVTIGPGTEGTVELPTGQVQTYSVYTSGASYTCVVHTTGKHELTGPLLGLDGGPLPLR